MVLVKFDESTEMMTSSFTVLNTTLSLFTKIFYVLEKIEYNY